MVNLMNLIDRRDKISIQEFQLEYMIKNKPVIITDGMEDWKALATWTPDYFITNYGEEEVQLYDDLFNLIDIVTLRKYIDEYFGKNLNLTNNKIIPYVRWYTQFKNHEFVWADNFFNKIQNHWKLPYFLPENNYLLPYNFNIARSLSPNQDKFPAKGIFISAKGAKTKLHYDPWCSDAVLCQLYGSKKIIMYSPKQKEFFCQGNELVDIKNSDYNKFLRFKQADPDFVDTLDSGEIVFFPHNWLHEVLTVEDSISVTWNFVHISTWASFFNYLINNPKIEELEVIKFFLNHNIENH